MRHTLSHTLSECVVQASTILGPKGHEVSGPSQPPFGNGYKLPRDKTVSMTSSITIRLSEDDIRKLKRYGRISDVVREAIQLYIQSESSRETVLKLEKLQASNKTRITIDEDLKLIHEDRRR
jgi:Arc/MetJ-type ribon-helix-helix transcriptional regulator